MSSNTRFFLALFVTSACPLLSLCDSGYHVPDRSCKIEYVKDEVEMCVPELVTECTQEEVTVYKPKKEQKCITVTGTNCKAEVETREFELCIYNYEYKELPAVATKVDVKYKKSCDTTYVRECKKKRNYGGYAEECKELPQEKCKNVPTAETEETDISVTVPNPVKKCEKKKLSLPSVSCKQETEERCFDVVTLVEAKETIEKCETKVEGKKCDQVKLKLPAQKCEEKVKQEKHYES